ncbi:hypothetical protein [Aeromicrobium sp. CTD01-1L150]|uniref:hypothetical protein n=1 Tax=Aeromicrobium sp. CTD01-1L150 TaxID=3341830 RepID=UPI0035BF74AD
MIDDREIDVVIGTADATDEIRGRTFDISIQEAAALAEIAIAGRVRQRVWSRDGEVWRVRLSAPGWAGIDSRSGLWKLGTSVQENTFEPYPARHPASTAGVGSRVLAVTMKDCIGLLVAGALGIYAFRIGIRTESGLERVAPILMGATFSLLVVMYLMGGRESLARKCIAAAGAVLGVGAVMIGIIFPPDLSWS